MLAYCPPIVGEQSSLRSGGDLPLVVYRTNLPGLTGALHANRCVIYEAGAFSNSRRPNIARAAGRKAHCGTTKSHYASKQ